MKMSQLSCLIEKHKQMQERSAFKSYYEAQEVESNANMHNSINCYNANNCINQESLSSVPNSTMSKVYVNPNYVRKPVIHINPRIQVKPSIYVNPKLIHNITNNQPICQQNPKPTVQANQAAPQINVYSKHSVHVNPKLMNKLISKVPNENTNQQQNQNNQRDLSSHIRSDSPNSTNILNNSIPLLSNRTDSLQNSVNEIMRKPILCSTPISQRKFSSNYTIHSKTKLVKAGTVLKKSPSSNLVSLSKRKLVRIKRSPKISVTSPSSSKVITPMKKRLVLNSLRKAKISPKNTVLTTSQLFKVNRLKLVRNTEKNKTSWHNKFDKNVSKPACSKKTVIKKSLNNSVHLVSISGIMYKKSRTQLVRSNSSTSLLKRKRSITSNKTNQYYIANNGKKLLKLDSIKKKVDTSSKLNTSNSSSKSYKTNASNKVKQRSLQILRNKMRKNNQPCLIFQRFGYCANLLTGTCHKVHDKKQVAVCKNFLQGKCLLDNCALSHNVGPEKMPTCKYFLEGCCTREGCPYLHVKVSSKSPICVEFLRGYCPDGNECQKRHVLACPEFDKTGKCGKGKYCPYPHKPLTVIKRMKGNMRHKTNVSNVKQPEKVTGEHEIIECRKRYYDETNQDLIQKRDNLLKQVKILKVVHSTQGRKDIDNNVEKSDVPVEESNESKKQLETLFHKPRRPALGPLPAYIPID